MSPALGTAIAGWVKGFMVPDPYANGDGISDIRSLYLDGQALRIYRETRAGVFARVKLRARTHSFEPDVPVYLDVKSRVGEFMRKTRVELDRRTADAVVWDPRPHLPAATLPTQTMSYG